MNDTYQLKFKVIQSEQEQRESTQHRQDRSQTFLNQQSGIGSKGMIAVFGHSKKKKKLGGRTMREK